MHLPVWLAAFIDRLPPRTTPKAEEPIMSEPLVATATAVVPATAVTTTTDATTGRTIYKAIVAGVEKVVALVEGEFHVVEADLGIGTQTDVVTAPAAPVVPTSTTVIAKVGDLLALAGRTPVAYVQIAALAVAAVGADTDAVLAKIKDLLAYSGSKIDVWDEVVALARAV